MHKQLNGASDTKINIVVLCSNKTGPSSRISIYKSHDCTSKKVQCALSPHHRCVAKEVPFVACTTITTATNKQLQISRTNDDDDDDDDDATNGTCAIPATASKNKTHSRESLESETNATGPDRSGLSHGMGGYLLAMLACFVAN